MWLSPYLLLPFDSVPGLLGLDSSLAQVFPVLLVYAPFVVASAIFMPHRFRRIGIVEISVIISIVLYLLAITFVVNLFSDEWVGQLSLSSFTRQLAALIGGICIYLSFRLFDIRLSIILRHVFFSIALTVPVVFYQLISSDGGLRLQGLSTEPSHFGHFLAFAAIPSVLAGGISTLRMRLVFLYLNICILLTFSITAYFSVVLIYICWAVNNRFFSVLRYAALLAVFIPVTIFLGSFDFAYLEKNASFFLSFDALQLGMESSASLTDRFYSVVGPVSGLFRLDIFFGYGIAGDYLALKSFVPESAYDLISSVRSGQVGVSSFFGKVAFWGGWVLSILYIWACFSFYRSADPRIRFYFIPVFVASFYSMGSLVYPYIWMWLAILKNSSCRGSDKHVFKS